MGSHEGWPAARNSTSPSNRLRSSFRQEAALAASTSVTTSSTAGALGKHTCFEEQLGIIQSTAQRRRQAAPDRAGSDYSPCAQLPLYSCRNPVWLCEWVARGGMRRREFVGVSIGGMAWASIGEAQQAIKLRRIGVLTGASGPDSQEGSWARGRAKTFG